MLVRVLNAVLLLLLLLLLLLPHSLEGPSLWCVHLKALTDGQR
jgi:hypothetical protein